jgi:hypothetical protein
MHVRWNVEDIQAKETHDFEEEDLERQTYKKYHMKLILRRKGIK